MFLIFAIVAILIGAVIYPDEGIGDIPLSQLTLSLIFRSLVSIAFYVAAAYFGFKSLEEDRIWPWRWSLPRLVRAWLVRRRTIKDLKSRIKKRKDFGYDSPELEEELNELQGPRDREKEYVREQRRLLGYEDDNK